MGTQLARVSHSMKLFQKGFIEGYDKKSLDEILNRGILKTGQKSEHEEQFLKKIQQLKYIEPSEQVLRASKLHKEAKKMHDLHYKLKKTEMDIPETIAQTLEAHRKKPSLIKKAVNFVLKKKDNFATGAINPEAVVTKESDAYQGFSAAVNKEKSKEKISLINKVINITKKLKPKQNNNSNAQANKNIANNQSDQTVGKLSEENVTQAQVLKTETKQTTNNIEQPLSENIKQQDSIQNK